MSSSSSSSSTLFTSPSLSVGLHTRRQSLILLDFVIVFLLSPLFCQGWMIHTSSSLSHLHNACPATTRALSRAEPRSLNIDDSTSVLGLSSSQTRHQISLASTATTTTSESLSSASDDDDDEYEYVEYDILTESEFMGSEWMVGTVMDNRPKSIGETWVRLATDRDGKNVAIWGDKAQGNWNFDVANQFLSVSKSAFWGKKIWAGVVNDYYFSRGTVRGWNFFSPASVVGQWQAKRLGVEAEEAGVAPWFEDDDEENKGEIAPAPTVDNNSNTNEDFMMVKTTSPDSNNSSS